MLRGVDHIFFVITCGVIIPENINITYKKCFGKPLFTFKHVFKNISDVRVEKKNLSTLYMYGTP